MNRSKRLSRNLAILCIVIGVVLLGIGLTLGGRIHSGWGVNFGDNFGIFSFDNPAETSHNLDAFDSIEVDVAVGDITIEQGDVFKLITKGYDKDSYDFGVENRKLQVSYKQPHSIFNLNIDFGSDKEIMIIVPKNIELNTVKIDSAMGDISLSDQTCKDLDVRQAMGDVELERILVNGNTYIDQKMGDITFLGELEGKSEFHNKMGEIEIIMQASSHEYRYDLKTSLGSIRLSDSKQSEKSNSSINGGDHDAPYEIYAKNAMGDIELEFY